MESDPLALIEPFRDPEVEHIVGIFQRDKVLRFYAKERRRNCNFMQLMNLWLVVPQCLDCATGKGFDSTIHNYIYPKDWENGIAWEVGESVVRRTRRLRRDDEEFAYLCKHCGHELRPWNGDEMTVGRIHVEEEFSVPTETPGRRKASRDTVRLIKEVYGNRCFGCRKRKRSLHIDHILPQSKGGTAAFRNLQPLCEPCGNAKADRLPDEVDVYSTVYFGPYTSDGSDAFKGIFA